MIDSTQIFLTILDSKSSNKLQWRHKLENVFWCFNEHNCRRCSFHFKFPWWQEKNAKTILYHNYKYLINYCFSSNFTECKESSDVSLKVLPEVLELFVHLKQKKICFNKKIVKMSQWKIDTERMHIWMGKEERTCQIKHNRPC